MRVLGVDPGLTRCGLAIVDVDPTRRVKLLQVEVTMTDPNLELGYRLAVIEASMSRLIAGYLPDVVAVERVFTQHNVRTVMGTAQAAGVAALVAARHGLPLALHTPSEVKAAVTGSGRADKKQVAAMVTRIVGGPVAGPADATDAIALAICHGWRGSSQNALQAVLATQARIRLDRRIGAPAQRREAPESLKPRRASQQPGDPQLEGVSP